MRWVYVCDNWWAINYVFIIIINLITVHVVITSGSISDHDSADVIVYCINRIIVIITDTIHVIYISSQNVLFI